MNMRLKSLSFLVAALALAALSPRLYADSAPPDSAADGKLTAAERAKAIKMLKDSEARTLDALEKLTDEQLKFKPATNKWSVLEVAEHIMLAESQIFGGAQKAVSAGPNPDWEAKTKGKTEFLEKALLDRSHKVQAPDNLVPTGKLSREEVIAQFKEARGRTLKFAEETQLPLNTFTFDAPTPIIGTLNAYQWLIFVALHNARHNLQIDEVMANPNFPKSTAKTD